MGSSLVRTKRCTHKVLLFFLFFCFFYPNPNSQRFTRNSFPPGGILSDVLIWTDQKLGRLNTPLILLEIPHKEFWSLREMLESSQQRAVAPTAGGWVKYVTEGKTRLSESNWIFLYIIITLLLLGSLRNRHFSTTSHQRWDLTASNVPVAHASLRLFSISWSVAAFVSKGGALPSAP